MSAILRTVYCIPCIWTVLCMLGTFGVCSFIMNVWVPFRGPLPADGPVEGFASKTARIEYYNTGPARIRSATKAGIIGGVLWAVGAGTAVIILTRLG
jgi:hypothetical protein